jgi:cellobiose transport system substrate-binding protein
MRVRTRRSRSTRQAVALAATVALGAGLLAGCSSDSKSPGSESSSSASSGAGDSTGAGDGPKTTLTMGVFGSFGLKEAGLYDQYMKENPNIKIEETSVERAENYYPALLTHLGSGSGLADIQAIEVNNISEVTTTLADKFSDLGSAPGVQESNFLDWKWQQGTTKDGTTIALGTDIGPQAICYRKDLFKKAGLPTDRDEVSKLWAGDWNKFLATGEAYQAKAPKGTHFVDGAATVFSAYMGSFADRYYDTSGKVVYKTNPEVKKGWDFASQFAAKGLTGKLEPFTEPWNQAFPNAAFAAINCPAWMLGYIQEHAGEKGKGQWDMAEAPRPSAWGGSFLAVPKAGKNQEEAAKLAAWLTAPAQQITLFTKRASFPSAKVTYTDPAVVNATHEYFEGAPIGKIFIKAAENIPVVITGPKDLVINQNLTNGILSIDQKNKNPETAWKDAQKAVDNALDQ